jgi:hypothetical protein
MDRRVKPIAANNNENNKPTSPTLESAGAGGDDCDKGGIADTSAKVSAAKGQNDSESAVSSTSSDNGKGDGGDISSASVEPKRAPRKISSFILSAPHVVSSVPGSAKKIVDKSAKKVKRLAEKTGTVSVLADFRDFISRGNVIDLAVALVMGSAFTAIVNSLVKDIINPLIALGMPANTFGGYSVIRPGGSGNWSYISLQAAQADGALVEVYIIFP